MPYRTTIAGSLPKPAWPAEPETLWPGWHLDGAQLLGAKRDAIRIAVAEQQHAGIDCVTDGEQARVHFVHGFVEALAGIGTQNKVRKGIRNNRYEADCPSVVGNIERRGPVQLDEVRFRAAVCPPRAKIHIAGPDDDRRHPLRRNLRRSKDSRIRIRSRAQRGDARARRGRCRRCSARRPAFNVFFDKVDAWGIDALDAAFNRRWKAALGEAWDQYAHIFPFLSRSSVDEVSIELAGSRVPAHVLSRLQNKDVAIGVIDVANDAVEGSEDVRATLDLAARYIAPERIIASTNCGMASMKRNIAYAKLAASGAGARGWRPTATR